MNITSRLFHFHRDTIDMTVYEGPMSDSVVHYDLGRLRCRCLGIPFPARVAGFLIDGKWRESDWYLQREFSSFKAADKASYKKAEIARRNV